VFKMQDEGQLTERDDVHDQHALWKRHVLEVDELHGGPDLTSRFSKVRVKRGCISAQYTYHPILLERLEVGGLELLLWVTALHNGHAGQKEEEVGAGEEALIGGHTGDDLEVGLAWEDNALLEKAEPLRGDWSEHEASVGSHASSASEIMALTLGSFHTVLRHGIAGSEQDCGGD
jgi:hypothetical protein